VYFNKNTFLKRYYSLFNDNEEKIVIKNEKTISSIKKLFKEIKFSDYFLLDWFSLFKLSNLFFKF